MVVFDIPFESVGPGLWALQKNECEIGEFCSRDDALECALAEAKRIEALNAASDIVLNIEGNDGVWRAFDTSIRPYAARTHHV
ncbi:hypothetical protein SAMN02800694_1386 [Luteibacter sp. UNCMF331Sha3.1]|uniref:hypothetical protein n=1 Tax=Luteibacter sp. UNCMF331Sha3.1 TaxID=1502760 RepID=UPI0008C8DF6F|nr:hypothetical protein [Luteibacter sp. UNCMF331Sha3.1]SEM52393.1 hypothetical protein SAMN02800694_1386 [Luteibacter sp. UNCMF331Sha3.1]